MSSEYPQNLTGEINAAFEAAAKNRKAAAKNDDWWKGSSLGEMPPTDTDLQLEVEATSLGIKEKITKASGIDLAA